MTGEAPRVDRLVERWPVLASQLHAALIDEDEPALAESVDALMIVQGCECSDDFCQSFYTSPPPKGPWGHGHANVWLRPPWPGMLILDVVGESITYVEVLYRPRPLD